MADSCRLTPVHSVTCGESTDITRYGAVLESLGETQEEEDGVVFQEDSNTCLLANLVPGASTETITFTSDTECLEPGHKVRIIDE